MAATDPAEPPPKRPESPPRGGSPSGPETEALGAATDDGGTRRGAPRSPGEERAAGGRSGAAGSGGGERRTGPPPEHPGETADTPGDQGWGFDWSETEEEGAQARVGKRGNHGPRAAGQAQEDDGAHPEEEERSGGDAVDGVGEEERGVDPDGERDAEAGAKPKKACLLCKDCGMVFNRRETFNLHRHFHAHEDELAPLTCKECGLTFQQRSGLVKHRNEHRERDEPLLTPKKEPPSEEGSFKCAECEVVFCTADSLRRHGCCGGGGGAAAEKPYHCPLCRQEFQFKVSVSKHMIGHSQECVFKCQECSQTFPDSLALRYHQRCHTALKPYKCPECGLVFKHYSVMEDHRRRHAAGARSHLCNVCGKAFKYGSLLHQHQYLHTGQKPFRCPECGKKFAFAQNMKAHCRQHRMDRSGAPSGPPGGGGAGAGREEKRPFKCPICPQAFAAAVNLTAHVIVHQAESETLERKGKPPADGNTYWDKGHRCTHCPCVFRDEKSLNSHLLSSHKCIAQYLENVGAPAKQVPQADAGDAEGKWRPEGAGAKSYRCPECGKSFRFRSVLELHMRMHSKDKPYQCKVCGKSFRFSSYLQQHVIIHTGKKPHKCPDCGKDFAFLQNMRTHQRLHQEKPFRCSSCRKGYSDEAQLQRHMLSHNGDKPHKCGLCSKSFGLAYLLRDHMNTHTGERPHRCDECSKSFSWFSSLLVHRKIHARKRQGFSQGGSSPAGARMRGRGSKGRQAWGSPRQPGSASQPSLYPTEGRREPAAVAGTLPRRAKEPIQWKVDGGEVMPVSSSPPPPPTRGSEAREGPPSSDAPPPGAAPRKSGPLFPEQSRQLKTVALSTAAASALLLSGGLVHRGSPAPPSLADGAAPWSARPAGSQGHDPQQQPGAPARPTPPPKKEEGKAGEPHAPSPLGQPEKPGGGPEPQAQWAPAAATVGQSGATPTPVNLGGGTTLWAIQAPPQTEKSASQDLVKQLSAGWLSLQGPAGAQKVPIALPFGQAVGTPVWSFQSNAVAQALLAAQLKPANGQELQQQQPMVTGTQIIINQPAPFLAPPLAPLSLQSVPVGALSRPSHPKIFFAPQAVMVERPPAPQAAPLPQLTPPAEPQKPGARLPFAPDRLLQCMICGCSLPRELDLQMHYLQHAQGEI